jgi:hypothetical protein
MRLGEVYLNRGSTSVCIAQTYAYLQIPRGWGSQQTIQPAECSPRENVMEPGVIHIENLLKSSVAPTCPGSGDHAYLSG